MRNMNDSASTYRGLIVMSALHLPLMYAIMFSMVYTWDEVVHNLNTLYMAGMMVAPMLLFMPILMRGLYTNKKLNLLVYTSSVAVFALLFYFMREQSFVGDRQFLRSMIPHHSGAILMCERSKIQDQEIKALCNTIIKGQKSEIEQMKTILKRL